MAKQKKLFCIDDDADDHMIEQDTIKEIDQKIELLMALNGNRHYIY